MDWDGYKLSNDERVVLDHVTGLCPVLPEPQGAKCVDREFVGELVATRSKVRALAITPPPLRLCFEDVLHAARQPEPQTQNRIFYHLSNRWGLGLMAAASVAVALVAGTLATGGLVYLSESASRDIAFNGQSQVEQFPVRTPPSISTSPPDASAYSAESELINDAAIGSFLIRTGSISLKHADPAEANRRITEIVTLMAGFVTRLTREGTGPDAVVSIEVAVPSDKFGEFTGKVAALGEVVSQTESAEDVTSQQIDLNARLTEAESYLKRLDSLSDKQSNLQQVTEHERRRREVSLEIERYRKALSSLSNRTSYARLSINMAATEPMTDEDASPLAQAWKDGVSGLEQVSAFMLKAGIAGSPFLLAGALAYMGIRRKRRKELQQA